MPEIRLKTVVLPAPFGPISACSVRSRTRNATLRTALMPPNDFASPDTSMIAPSKCAAGLRKAGNATSPDCRLAIAASSATVFLQRRATRSYRPTSPSGEKTMKATNSRPK